MSKNFIVNKVIAKIKAKQTKVSEEKKDLMSTVTRGSKIQHKKSGIVYTVTAGTQKGEHILAKYVDSFPNYRLIISYLFSKEFQDFARMPRGGFDPYEAPSKSLGIESFKFSADQLNKEFEIVK